MDLWIRSQSKEVLVKADAVYIVERISEYKKYYYIEDEKYRYAKYKTKERALEIIDEIVQILQPKGVIKYNSLLRNEDIRKIQERNKNYIFADGQVDIIQMPETYVYQMPEE